MSHDVPAHRLYAEGKSMFKPMRRNLWVMAALLGLGILSASAQQRDRDLVVMTRNMDTGSDFGFVLGATTPTQVLLGVTATYQEIVASNIAERAAGVAAEIQARQPDLVALQEVTELRIGPLGGPATTVVGDGLQSLLAALAQRGLHYAPVAIQGNADVEVPALDQFLNPFDVRLTDFDVMLARFDLPISQLTLENVQQGHFQTELVFPILDQQIPFPRGWIAVDAKLRGKPYRVITTHLENFSFAIQEAQALELVNGPANTALPVVLAGDFNSDADSSDPLLSASYNILIDAGFVDIWRTMHAGDPGFTWPLHGEDPFTPLSAPNQRIDLILARSGSKGIDADDVAVIGNTLSDLTPSGLWPSDHAGVVALFTLLP